MRNVDFDIDLLRCFLAIVETGSFTLAADRVCRTQSAVSQRMRRLEELAGCRLIERGGRSAALTKKGEAVHAIAEQLVAYNDAIVRALTAPLPGRAPANRPAVS